MVRLPGVQNRGGRGRRPLGFGAWPPCHADRWGSKCRGRGRARRSPLRSPSGAPIPSAAAAHFCLDSE